MKREQNKMNQLKKWKGLSKDLYKPSIEPPSYYMQQIDEMSKISELQSTIASLSNSNVALVLMDTAKQIAYANVRPNHEVICEYLEIMIEDLKIGMSDSEIISKYDEIYEVYYK